MCVTVASLFEVLLCQFDLPRFGSSFDDIVIRFLIRLDIQEAHLMNDLVDALLEIGWVLLGYEIEQEVEILQCVGSLIEETLHLYVDPLVHILIMILLI